MGAFEFYNKSAASGNSKAQCSLGCAYMCGRGVPKNGEKAFELYNQSAASGNADAQYNVGSCCHLGIGCEQNSELSAEWYEKAANQGHALAVSRLLGRSGAIPSSTDGRRRMCGPGPGRNSH